MRVAALAFAAVADPVPNRRRIAAAITEAAAAGAQVLLTPEAALCGYPGAARESLSDLDGCALAEHEEVLLLAAERAGLLLVLGSASAHPQGGWSNDALVGGALPPQRYRKRCLTPLDEQHFRPGAAAAPMLRLNGWTLGLTICYEVRFPVLWGDLAAAGADTVLTIAHMAGNDAEPGTKPTVVPQHYASRAAEWATPLVLCNTAAADRWLDSAAWDARGLRQTAMGEGLLIADLVKREQLHWWYGRLHRDAVAVHRTTRGMGMPVTPGGMEASSTA